MNKKRFYVYGKTISELEKNKRQLLIDYELGLSLHSKDVLFKDYKYVWFDNKKPSISAKSIASYDSILKNHFTLIDYMKVTDIKKSHIQKVINELIDKPNTANKTNMTLNQIMENAVDD